jgi:hypothetical protein
MRDGVAKTVSKLPDKMQSSSRKATVRKVLSLL